MRATNERTLRRGLFGAVLVAILAIVLLAGACGSDDAPAGERRQPSSRAVGFPTPTLARMRENALRTDGGLVLVGGPLFVEIIPGSAARELEFEIVHYGSSAEIYEIEIESALSFVDISMVPGVIEVQPDETIPVIVSLVVPAGTRIGTEGKVIVRATLRRNVQLLDSAVVRITVVAGADPAPGAAVGPSN